MSNAWRSGDQQRFRIQRELVNTLERTQLMRAQASRQLLIDHLREQLSPLALVEHPELRLQVAEMVRACARAPDGIRVMVEVVEHLQPGTKEGTQLHRLANEWEVVDILSEEDWSQLRPALQTASPRNLTWLYQRATGDRLPSPPWWCANAWQVFVYLSGQLAGPDGLPPSMLFLLLLEPEVDPPIAELIRRRNRHRAGADRLTSVLDNRRSEISSGKDQPEEATAYLVIQIEPALDPDNQDDPESYLVSYSHQWRGASSWESRQSDLRRAPRDQLERQVERLIEQMEMEWSDRPGTVMVEFVLPWGLLNAAVDWWCKESGSSRPTALTMDYPVVIRSLERLRARRWHRAWHRRWRQLRTAPVSSRVYWSKPSGTDYFTRLESELKADDQFVSLVLSEPPTRHSRTGQQEIEAALRAGLPVIIWHREDSASAAFREAVTRLVSDGGLAQLPMRAKQLRLEALRLEPDSREGHVGRHLTILWDDPERKPDTPGATSGRVAGEIR